MALLQRNEYLDALRRWRDKDVIKVITGIRRCGKSTLLELFRAELLEGGVDASHIVSVNLEDFAFENLLNPQELHAYVLDKAAPEGKTYVFLDEVQNVKDFQRVVDSLFLRKNIDLYITGSNAYLLSGELATLLSGRYVTIEMLPLSFAEYVEWTGTKDNLPHKYQSYLETSSFPYALELASDSKAVRTYLEGIYNTVILKDVAGRLKTVDPMMLESILRFAFSSLGSPISSKRIADALCSNGRKIDSRTVEKYLVALTNSFILYRAGRYDVRGKQHLKSLEKYYAVDLGLRFMLLGGRGLDVGHILENVVYLELLRRGYDVAVGKVGDMEVDFVASSPDGLFYVQVAASVRDPKTLERELRVLQKINDNYPKVILTLDEDIDADYEGIRRKNALRWLIDK